MGPLWSSVILVPLFFKEGQIYLLLRSDVSKRQEPFSKAQGGVQVRHVPDNWQIISRAQDQVLNLKYQALLAFILWGKVPFCSYLFKLLSPQPIFTDLHSEDLTETCQNTVNVRAHAGRTVCHLAAVYLCPPSCSMTLTLALRGFCVEAPMLQLPTGLEKGKNSKRELGMCREWERSQRAP